MKVSIQKTNAIGELIVVEVEATGPEDPNVIAALELADRRMLEMNNRIIVATEIERRFGPETAMAVREVTDVMFGTKPLTEKQISDALSARDVAQKQLIEESKRRKK